jgi:hypothetical protein
MTTPTCGYSSGGGEKTTPACGHPSGGGESGAVGCGQTSNEGYFGHNLLSLIISTSFTIFDKTIRATIHKMAGQIKIRISKSVSKPVYGIFRYKKAFKN